MNNTKNSENINRQIREIQTTDDKLTGRAGLALFVKYMESAGLLSFYQALFGSIRKSEKGLNVRETFKQLFCFMLDGTSRRLTHFDSLKKDDGHAGAIEASPEDMLSSHSVKRFFKKISFARIHQFRRVLQRLFIWRLNLLSPPVIVLGIDTMVMDNDDALKRHGVKPTYKKVKGFQPLQMNWGRFIVDAVFRGGDKHSNHGKTVQEMILHMVGLIRKKHSESVPIIIRMDSGFFDQKIFEVCEELGVGYVCGGKMYKDVKEMAMAMAMDEKNYRRLESGDGNKEIWEYAEFGTRRGNWKKFRRAFYCRLINEGGQYLLPCSRPDTVIVTNLGQGGKIDKSLKRIGAKVYLDSDMIVSLYHGRGSDELVNRALKDFGHEQLPFKRFESNAAWYFVMLISFFMFETFKEDAFPGVVPLTAYAGTVRRKVIDVSGKIVSHGRKIILKLSKAAYETLKITETWERCQHPPVFDLI